MAAPFTNEPIADDEPKVEAISPLRQRMRDAAQGAQPAPVKEAVPTQADTAEPSVSPLRQRMRAAVAAPAPVAKPTEAVPTQAAPEPAKPAEIDPNDDGGLPYLFQTDKIMSEGYKPRGDEDEALIVLVKFDGSMSKAQQWYKERGVSAYDSANILNKATGALEETPEFSSVDADGNFVSAIDTQRGKLKNEAVQIIAGEMSKDKPELGKLLKVLEAKYGKWAVSEDQIRQATQMQDSQRRRIQAKEQYGLELGDDTSTKGVLREGTVQFQADIEEDHWLAQYDAAKIIGSPLRNVADSAGGVAAMLASLGGADSGAVSKQFYNNRNIRREVFNRGVQDEWWGGWSDAVFGTMESGYLVAASGGNSLLTAGAFTLTTYNDSYHAARDEGMSKRASMNFAKDMAITEGVATYAMMKLGKGVNSAIAKSMSKAAGKEVAKNLGKSLAKRLSTGLADYGVTLGWETLEEGAVDVIQNEISKRDLPSEKAKSTAQRAKDRRDQWVGLMKQVLLSTGGSSAMQGGTSIANEELMVRGSAKTLGVKAKDIRKVYKDAQELSQKADKADQGDVQTKAIAELFRELKQGITAENRQETIDTTSQMKGLAVEEVAEIFDEAAAMEGDFTENFAGLVLDRETDSGEQKDARADISQIEPVIGRAYNTIDEMVEAGTMDEATAEIGRNALYNANQTNNADNAIRAAKAIEGLKKRADEQAVEDAPAELATTPLEDVEVTAAPETELDIAAEMAPLEAEPAVQPVAEELAITEPIVEPEAIPGPKAAPKTVFEVEQEAAKPAKSDEVAHRATKPKKAAIETPKKPKALKTAPKDVFQVERERKQLEAQGKVARESFVGKLVKAGMSQEIAENETVIREQMGTAFVKAGIVPDMATFWKDMTPEVGDKLVGKDKGAQGAYDAKNDKIYLFPTANASTPGHEIFHEMMEKFRIHKIYNHEDYKAAMSALEKEFGAKNHKFGRTQIEEMATQYEVWRRTGKAPTARIAKAFKAMQKLLKALYTAIQNNNGIKVNPVAEAWFRTMTGEQVTATEVKVEKSEPSRKAEQKKNQQKASAVMMLERDMFLGEDKEQSAAIQAQQAGELSDQALASESTAFIGKIPSEVEAALKNHPDGKKLRKLIDINEKGGGEDFVSDLGGPNEFVAYLDGLNKRADDTQDMLAAMKAAPDFVAQVFSDEKIALINAAYDTDFKTFDELNESPDLTDSDGEGVVLSQVADTPTGRLKAMNDLFTDAKQKFGDKYKDAKGGLGAALMQLEKAINADVFNPTKAPKLKSFLAKITNLTAHQKKVLGELDTRAYSNLTVAEQKTLLLAVNKLTTQAIKDTAAVRSGKQDIATETQAYIAEIRKLVDETLPYGQRENVYKMLTRVSSPKQLAKGRDILKAAKKRKDAIVSTKVQGEVKKFVKKLEKDSKQKDYRSDIADKLKGIADQFDLLNPTASTTVQDMSNSLRGAAALYSKLHKAYRDGDADAKIEADKVYSEQLEKNMNQLLRAADLLVQEDGKASISTVRPYALNAIARTLTTLNHMEANKGNFTAAINQKTRQAAQLKANEDLVKFNPRPNKIDDKKNKRLLGIREKLSGADALLHSYVDDAEQLGGSKGETHDILIGSLVKANNEAQQFADARRQSIGDTKGIRKAMKKKHAIKMDGKDVEVTGGQLAYMYGLLSDEDIVAKMNEGLIQEITLNTDRGRTHRFNVADLRTATAKLNPVLKSYMDSAISWRNNEQLKVSNEAHMERTGNTLSTKNRFPSFYDSDFRTHGNNTLQREYTRRLVEDMGTFKARQEAGKNLMVMDGVVTMERDATVHNAYAFKMNVANDAKAILDDTEFQKTTRRNVIGGDDIITRMNEAIDEFVLHKGMTSSSPKEFTNFIMKNFVKSVMGNKPKIMAGQVASIVAASTEIKSVYLARGLKMSLRDSKMINQFITDHSASLALRRMHDPTSIVSSVGDTDGGKVQGDKSLLESTQDFGMKGIRVMDMVAVRAIVGASMIEGKKKGWTNEEIANRAEEIVDRTQPTYDVLTRSNIQVKAHSNILLKMLLMFTTQPFKNTSTIRRQFRKMSRGEISKKRGYYNIGKTMIIQQAMLMTMRGVVEGLYGALGAGFEDDDRDLFDKIKFAMIDGMKREWGQTWKRYLTGQLPLVNLLDSSAGEDIWNTIKSTFTTAYDIATDDKERTDEAKARRMGWLTRDVASVQGLVTGVGISGLLGIILDAAKQDKPEAAKLAKSIGTYRDSLKNSEKIEEGVDRLKEMGFDVDDAKQFAKEKIQASYDKRKAKYDKEMANLDSRNEEPTKPKPPSKKYIDRVNRRIEKRWEGDYSRDIEDVQDDAYRASGNRTSTSRKSIARAVAHLKREKVTLKEAVSMIRLAAKRKHASSMARYAALKARDRGRKPESITRDELDDRVANLKKEWRR